MADDWLTREVVAGLMGLVALRLDGAPPTDAITHTLDIWLVALKKRQRWSEDEDSRRLKAAFETLFATCERWPAPARLLQEMSPRIEKRALPRPALTDEQRASGRKQVNEILSGLKQRNKISTNTEQHPQ